MASTKTETDAASGILDSGWRLELPPPEHLSEEELERRRKLYDEVMRLREKIGPIGIRADELIHQAREEDDA